MLRESLVQETVGPITQEAGAQARPLQKGGLQLQRKNVWESLSDLFRPGRQAVNLMATS